MLQKIEYDKKIMLQCAKNFHAKIVYPRLLTPHAAFYFCKTLQTRITDFQKMNNYVISFRETIL